MNMHVLMRALLQNMCALLWLYTWLLSSRSVSQNLRSEEKTLHQVRNISAWVTWGRQEDMAGRHGRCKICYSEQYWSVSCTRWCRGGVYIVLHAVIGPW